MDQGTRHFQSCLLLNSPTNASMHDRCIWRYLKFRGLCICPYFVGKKSKQWTVYDTRSAANTFSFITDQMFKKDQQNTLLPCTKALIVHGTDLNTNFLLK